MILKESEERRLSPLLSLGRGERRIGGLVGDGKVSDEPV